MTLRFHRRTWIRLISYFLATCLVLGVWLGMTRSRAVYAERLLEYSYLRALSSLSDGLSDIQGDLAKLTYVSTPSLLSHMASRIWRTAAQCKESLAALSVDSAALENANRYLSQTGDYCMALARDFAAGTPLTPDAVDNLTALGGYGEQVLTDLLVLQDEVQTGHLRLMDYEGGLSGTQPVATTGEESQDSLPEYPTLLYDGPFSDHMQSRTSVYLGGFRVMSPEDTRTRAASLLGVLPDQVEEDGGEESLLPCDTYLYEAARIAITRQGGFLCYYLKPRQVTEAGMDTEDAIDRAVTFAAAAGYDGLEPSYYELRDNLLTVQLVRRQGDILCYPDQVKVEVALDNGEVLGCDARSYLMNHQQNRTLPAPAFSSAEAAGKLSAALAPGKVRLCIIPSEGMEELFCYEVQAVAQDGTELLVYLNAVTGEEEKILILSVTENGQLAL